MLMVGIAGCFARPPLEDPADAATAGDPSINGDAISGDAPVLGDGTVGDAPVGDTLGGDTLGGDKLTTGDATLPPVALVTSPSLPRVTMRAGDPLARWSRRIRSSLW